MIKRAMPRWQKFLTAAFIGVFVGYLLPLALANHGGWPALSDSPGAEPVATSPDFTITTGEAFGVSFTLSAYETSDGICVNVDYKAPSVRGSGGGCGFSVAGEVTGQSTEETRAVGWNATCTGLPGTPGTLIFGPVVRTADGVKLTLATTDSDVIIADVLRGPPELNVDFFLARVPRCVEVQSATAA